MKQIGDKVFWYIRNNFDTQKDAAEHYGVNPVAVSQWVTNRRPPCKEILDDMGYERRVTRKVSYIRRKP